MDKIFKNTDLSGSWGYSLGAAAAVAAGLSLVVLKTRAQKPARATPPGPKRRWIIGNLLDFPQERWYETFTEWQAKWGDVIYVELLGMPMLVVSDLTVAEDLLTRRSGIWSNRAYSPMVNEEMGFNWVLPTKQPGKNFDEQRSILHKALGPRAVHEFDHLVNEQAHVLVQSLKAKKGDPHSEIINAIGAVLLKLSYGDRVYQKHGEELAKLNIENSDLIVTALTQLWFVNLFPILRYLPDRFPAPFKVVARHGREVTHKIRFWAFGVVQQDLANGTADPSLVSQHLSEGKTDAGNLRDAVGMLYSGGTDTTATAILTTIAYLLMNKDVQDKVHQELDRVVGKNRTPTVVDCKSLPYLNAVWKEAFRLNPPVPLGIPHINSEDDVWNGYKLPKGTMVHANIGFMMRDPRVWGDDADQFRPERFLDSKAADLPDLNSIPFGFGRRICPGRFLALNSGLTYLAAILSAYEVVTVSGETAPVALEYEDMAIRRPSNVRCQFKARA